MLSYFMFPFRISVLNRFNERKRLSQNLLSFVRGICVDLFYATDLERSVAFARFPAPAV